MGSSAQILVRLMDFFLGVHRAYWLWMADAQKYLRGIPLFISRNTLSDVKTWHEAVDEWSLDSGAFTLINKHGSWSAAGITPRNYIEFIRRCQGTIGGMRWAASMDMMCEPFIVSKTGLSVRKHIDITVGNWLELKSIDSTIPIPPPIQGYTLQDYLDCVDLYANFGIDLFKHPLVTLGSVCRRQSTDEIEVVVSTLASMGLQLHGFGVKTKGFSRYARHLVSADSMAWSYQARKNPAPHSHPHNLGNCANCYIYAAEWWHRVNPRKATA